MGFLTPTARPSPNLLGRFGRLVHWIALGIAALIVLRAIFAVSAFAPMPPPGTPWLGFPREGWLVLAALFALVGRAARYLFAGE